MTEVLVPSRRASDTRIIALVAGAHFVSHYYILLLPPLFLFVRAEYGVSFTELGLALTAFNVTSAAFQTPAGFLVDRIGARIVLVGGLLIGAAAAAVAGLVPSFWVFVAMFGFAGVANAVYHPADYALLSHFVSAERMSRAYSIHSFAGFFGSAVAPVSLLFLEAQVGWRGAMLAAAILALAMAALLMAQPAATMEAERPAKTPAGKGRDGTGWRLLLTGPILLNLVFFMFFAIANAGLQNYSVVALGALFGTAPTIANSALTAYLLLSAGGVLVGGYVAGRYGRHGLIAMAGAASLAGFALLIGTVDLGTLALMLVMGAAGFCFGFITPSRDMIVSAVTPPGSFGKVFGFVTTGFNVGGMVSPLAFGWLMDTGRPQGIFYVTAGAALLAIATVLPSLRRR
jgi:FSR family fosmidomycin resistance protein-like MFS transporter